MTKKGYEDSLKNWIEDEKAALELIRVVGKLWLDKSVELIIFRNQMVDRSSSELLNLHHYTRNVVNQPLTVHDTLGLAKALHRVQLAPSRIDIGKLGVEWLAKKQHFVDEMDFVLTEMKRFIGGNKINLVPKDVVLYGFGRIGRLAARELISQAGKGEQLRLRAIVTRDKSPEDILKRADLLRTDSVHGIFPGTVIADLENQCILVNGQKIHMISAKEPEAVDYTTYGIHNALLIDNTGVMRDREGLSRHLKAKGIEKVLLTAPGKGDVPTVVYGVNNETIDENETIFSAASCTTNALVPVLKVVNDALGIEKGHIQSVHSYTNDQNLLDNFHKKYRRGRAAALNMVITETGAEKAIVQVLPELGGGKFTTNAIRVPTPNVSLAVINLQLKEAVTKDSINEIMRQAALTGDLVEQIQYSMSRELVSSDLIGHSCSSIFDSPSTIVSNDGRSVVLYVWYDNEYGYTRQVIRLSKQLAGVLRLRYY